MLPTDGRRPSPFGVGALRPPSVRVSLIHAGLDAWPFDEGTRLTEFRVDDEPRPAAARVDFSAASRLVGRSREEAQERQSTLTEVLPFLLLSTSGYPCPRCGRNVRGWVATIGRPPECEGPIEAEREKGQ